MKKTIISSSVLSLCLLTGIVSCFRATEVPPAPIADFDFSSDNEFVAPVKIKFTDLSKNAAEIKWDFSDGTSSTEKEPVKSFTKSGNFQITLSVRDNINRRDSKTRFVTITAPPAPNFVTILMKATNNGVAPCVVTFTPTVQNATQFIWSFGDLGSGENNTSTLPSPQHEYKIAGEYLVTVAGTGIGGTVSKEVRVTIR